MAIRIVKKVTTEAPATIVRQSAPEPTPAPRVTQERPIAPKHLLVDCSFCSHPYIHPCHGKDERCMNAKFIRDRDARKVG